MTSETITPRSQQMSVLDMVKWEWFGRWVLFFRISFFDSFGWPVIPGIGKLDKGVCTDSIPCGCTFKDELVPTRQRGRGSEPRWIKSQERNCTWHTRELGRCQVWLGHWITRASQEEKSGKCIGPRSRKALKITLIFGPDPVCVGPEGFLWGCVWVQLMVQYSTEIGGRGD